MTPIIALLAPLLLASSPAPVPLTTGAPLPALRGELLTGRDVELPGEVRGRVTLLAFGFSRGASEDVDAWAKRFRGAFGADTATTWLEVPVMGGTARLMRGLITGAMRGGTPEADRSHLMTVWGVADEWKHRLGFDRPKPAYVVLLDREGRVRWRGTGPLDEAKWKQLSEAVEAAR